MILFTTTGSPLGSGFSKKQKRKTPRLSVMPLCVLACCHFEDRACPVCYYCYLRKFLKKKDRRALFLIAKNCECDFIDDDVKDGKPEKESRFFENIGRSAVQTVDPFPGKKPKHERGKFVSDTFDFCSARYHIYIYRYDLNIDIFFLYRIL